MRHKIIRASVCAMALAVMFSGSLYMTEGKGKQVQAAPVMASIMPAAGVGLVLDEGVPISQIRDEVKKRKRTPPARQRQPPKRRRQKQRRKLPRKTRRRSLRR